MTKKKMKILIKKRKNLMKKIIMKIENKNSFKFKKIAFEYLMLSIDVESLKIQKKVKENLLSDSEKEEKQDLWTENH